MAFAINHLTGRARLCGTAKWNRQTPACSSFQAFSKELHKVFSMGIESSFHLCQGVRTVADYAIDFRTLACLSNWNMADLRDAFLH